MTRKRFPAEQLLRQADQARIDDQISPPTREVSLTDVVRAMSVNIQARRDAGHSFPRIADWLNALGYEITAATLCVYWHRISADRVPQRSAGSQTRPASRPPPITAETSATPAPAPPQSTPPRLSDSASSTSGSTKSHARIRREA